MYVTLEDGTLQEIPIHDLLHDRHISITLGEASYTYEMIEKHIRDRMDFRFSGEPDDYAKLPEEEMRRILAAQEDLMIMQKEAADFAGETTHPYDYLLQNAEYGNYSHIHEGTDYERW